MKFGISIALKASALMAKTIFPSRRGSKMQANQLSATQFMSNFLAGANSLIAEKINIHQFSQELQTQHTNYLQNGSQQSVSRTQPKPLQEATLPTTATTSTQHPGTSHALQTDDQKQTKHKKHAHHKSADQIERQLLFNNPMLLENVINHLHLSAGTRDACKAAEDDQGRLSLKALYDILDKAQPLKSAANNQDGATAQSVQQLMASLSQIGQDIQPLSLNVDVKPKGTYDLQQFRQLLQGIVSQIQDKNSKPDTTASSAAATADSGEGSETAGDSQQTGKFEKIPNVDTASNTAIPASLAEAVDQDSSPRHPQHPAPAQAKPATAKHQKPLQSAANQPPDTAKNKPTDSVTLNTASAEPSKAPSQARTDQPAQAASSAAPKTSGNKRGSSTPSASPDQPAKQTQTPAAPLSSNQPNGVSLSQLSSPDGTVLASLQRTSSSNRFDGEQAPSGVSTDSNAAFAGTTPGAGKITSENSSGNSFGRQEDSQKGDNFTSAMPANKAGGMPMGGFSQVTQTVMQQTAGTFSASANPPQENPTLSMQDASWPEKLAEQFQGLHEEGGTQLTLELNPKGLGHLTLHLETQQNQVHAFISTDNEQARSLLMQNAEALRSSLQQQGLMLGQMSVDVRRDNSDGQPSNQQKTQSKRASRKTGVGKVGSREAVSAQARYQTRSENQLINLFT